MSFRRNSQQRDDIKLSFEYSAMKNKSVCLDGTIFYEYILKESTKSIILQQRRDNIMVAVYKVMYKSQALVLLFSDKGLHSIHDAWTQHQREWEQSLSSQTLDKQDLT